MMRHAFSFYHLDFTYYSYCLPTWLCYGLPFDSNEAVVQMLDLLFKSQKRFFQTDSYGAAQIITLAPKERVRDLNDLENQV